MSMPATLPGIAIVQVNEILQGARAQGLDIHAILRRADIAPALLEAPRSRVSLTQYSALMRVLRRITADEFWGLCSARLTPGSFAHACRLMLQCATLGEALQVGCRVYQLLLSDFKPRLVIDSGVASVRLIARAARCERRAYAQRVFCFFSYRVACWLSGRRIPLQALSYPPEDACHGSKAARIFVAPISCDQPFFSLHFDAKWLDLPIVQSSASLKEFLLHAPASLLPSHGEQPSLSEQVRRLLRRDLKNALPSLELISSALAMTPQTLRRRLHSEGQGYQAIKDALRRDIAIDYLARPEFSLPDIASRLGYSELSTFHRAFKGWTGVSPGSYRQDSLLARRSARADSGRDGLAGS